MVSTNKWPYDTKQCDRLVSRMLSVVKVQAFGDLADIAGANAAEKRTVAGSRTFSGKRVRVEQQMMSPVTATTASSGVLMCEAIRAVLVYQDCPQLLLCAQF